MVRLIAEINLSGYFVGGRAWLYNTVKSLHKPVYEDDERLLFYLDVSDIYEYNDGRGEIELCLDQFLQEIDIPEYFVIKRFAPVRDMKEHADTKCIFPWIQLYIDPTGKQAPCCYSSGDFGNITDHATVTDAMNVSAFKQLRLAMLANQRHRSCAMCYESEDRGMASERQLNTYNRFAHHAHLFDSTNQDGSVTDFATRYAVIGLDNICNFKCRICNSKLSSRIEAEDIKLGYLDQPWPKARKHSSFAVFMQDFKQQLPGVEKLHFFGGEPLLMEEHYSMLDALLVHGNRNLELMYHTNLSTLTYKQISVLDYWRQFSTVTVIASLDAMGSRAEYARHGTNWQQIMTNLQDIKRSVPHVQLSVDTTFSIYNLLHVTDLHRFLIEQGLFKAQDIDMHHVRGDMNDPRMVPASIKQIAANNIQSFMDWLKSRDDSSRLIELYQDMLDYMLSEDRSYLLPDFLERTKKIDAYRQEDFAQTFPELQSIIALNP